MEEKDVILENENDEQVLDFDKYDVILKDVNKVYPDRKSVV